MGLITIQKEYGILQLKDVLSAAIEFAQNGITINKHQSDIIKLVDPILTFDKTGSDLFTKNNRLITEGDQFSNPAFADFLKALINIQRS